MPPPRTDVAEGLLGSCRVCPRRCGVNRRSGEKGYCGLDHRLHLACAVVHHGEEPCFAGQKGVGNFFFSSCNLACVFCQNHLISQGRLRDSVVSTEQFVRQAMAFEAQGVHFIGLVTPSPQLPQIREALIRAKEEGLTVPVLYNSSGYDSVPALSRWEGLIDVYLPDMKFADNALAAKYCGAKDYKDVSRQAVLEMYRQVGDIRIDAATGLAGGGLWVRHLVLPEGRAGTWETLCFLALEVSRKIGLSLMAQYTPTHRAHFYPEIARPLLPGEYEEAVAMAEDLGFENLLCQELPVPGSPSLPDFTDTRDPFRLESTCDFRVGEHL